MPHAKSTSSTSKPCVRCLKNKPLPGAARCRTCQDVVNAQQKVLREQRKLTGLCKCGREAPRDGRADCNICAAAISQCKNVTFRKRKAAGLCNCGAPPTDGYKSCTTCRKRNKRSNDKIRRRVFEYYGMTCACCGEDMYEFLEIDHINGNGNDHRREISCGLYKWLIINNFPPGFQTLCSNCNRAKFRYGECPHKRQQRSN